MSLENQIDKDKLPSHVAIIMDGNGRWAKKNGKNRIFGHKNGVDRVREITEAAAKLGINYLTLYTFSTENWNRPQFEVTALMELLVQTLRKETKILIKNNIRLKAIGDLSSLPDKCHKELMESMEITKNNDRMDLILALNYSGRSEILQAVQAMLKDSNSGRINPDEISEAAFNKYLYTADVPDPELLVRTSGEYRISNFLLWQLAYTEFYFSDVFWPEFDEEELFKAIIDYQQRERRFGKTSEQLA